jgi:GNAT superfamily N-acetyltransferase/RimJ/RimL family protein N-acetyltransferase
MTEQTAVTTTERAVVIEPLVVPSSLDASDAGRFLDMVRIGNEMCRYDIGTADLDEDAQSVLGRWQDGSDWESIGRVALVDDVVIGVAMIRVSTSPEATTAEFDVIVDPERWGEGAEEALYAETERVARERGRTAIRTWTLHRPGERGAMLPSPTGYGAVPASDRQTVAVVRAGFELGQVERNSAFDLRGSYEAVDRLLADALDRLDPAYRPVSWTATTPEEYLEGYAYVLSRMSTDTPAGELTMEEEHWDAERVRRRDRRLAAEGMFVSVAAILHVPTGRIVAYNELVIPGDRTGTTSQYGTLVVKEHRGHRLGTIVKCRNLQDWRDLVPDSPRVTTFNAEENRPMLDINEALGFVPVSYAGAWQKTLG